MTALYSVLHFFVDGVCALSMFGYFAAGEKWYFYLLLYNFCAFAMQMPLGVVLDCLNSKEKYRKYSPSFGFAVAGVVVTLLGTITSPVVLGIGNALFHLGGGVGTIYEDEAKGWQGRGLGVFVAPGALGLYIGTQLAKAGTVSLWLVLTSGVMLVLCLLGGRLTKIECKRALVDRLENVAGRKALVAEQENTAMGQQVVESGGAVLLLVVGCFVVVILRSYIGMAVGFSWKTTIWAGVLAVLAVVLGKAAGGFLAAGFGWRKTAVVSLLTASVCYIFSQYMPIGLLALFLFNMTMPITLYLMVQRLRSLPGFAFGVLTFGLFLGFLPEYFGLEKPVTGALIGCIGSLVSLVILLLCAFNEEKSKECCVAACDNQAGIRDRVYVTNDSRKEDAAKGQEAE